MLESALSDYENPLLYSVPKKYSYICWDRHDVEDFVKDKGVGSVKDRDKGEGFLLPGIDEVLWLRDFEGFPSGEDEGFVLAFAQLSVHSDRDSHIGFWILCCCSRHRKGHKVFRCWDFDQHTEERYW